MFMKVNCPEKRTSFFFHALIETDESWDHLYIKGVFLMHIFIVAGPFPAGFQRILGW